MIDYKNKRKALLESVERASTMEELETARLELEKLDTLHKREVEEDPAAASVRAREQAELDYMAQRETRGQVPPFMGNDASVSTAAVPKVAPNQILFRSGETASQLYNTADINVEKVLRAAITGQYSTLNEAETRAITPQSGGALLSPVVSAMMIDALRKNDWLAMVEPTYVKMDAPDVVIPEISTLPVAVMHEAGVAQDTTGFTIGAHTLSAKTMMVLVEVSNELLQDSAAIDGMVYQASLDAISNKLLEQVMYGTGEGAEMLGITQYDEDAFAVAGDKSEETDVYGLFTTAKTAILRNNGKSQACIYDPDIEPRLNERLSTGELLDPSRAFTELYNAGGVEANQSIVNGDLLFMKKGSLYIGIRAGIEVQIDPYSSFSSNNTKFRFIIRADAFPYTKHMAYFSDIPATKPVAAEEDASETVTVEG